MPTSCKSSSQRNATLAWWNHSSIYGQTECWWQTGQGIFSFLLKLCWVKNKKNGVWWVTAAGSKNYTTCFTPHKKNPLPPAVCAVTVTKRLLSRFCTEHSDFHWAFYPPGPCLSWQRGRWSKMPVSVTNTDSSCSRQIYTAVHTWAISTCWSFVTGKCTIASYINRIFVTSVCTHSICV